MDYPRPLLVVGAKGSGKTSLVKLIAERLESDREVLPGLPSRLHYVIR